EMVVRWSRYEELGQSWPEVTKIIDVAGHRHRQVREVPQLCTRQLATGNVDERLELLTARAAGTPFDGRRARPVEGLVESDDRRSNSGVHGHGVVRHRRFILET